MTKHERLFATLAGEPVDRPAASFWRHFYPEETTADGLASAMLDFQMEFDWDFIKVNPRAVYHVEDWGNTYEFSTESDKNHIQKSHRVHEPADWSGLEVLNPNEGVLGQHLDALRQLDEGLRGEVPYIMTIFNPISIAGHLTGGAGKLMEHIESDPDAVREGLDVITETFIGFARACLEVGATGIFFPTTAYASSNQMTIEKYNGFGRPYDLRFLEAVQDAKFNLLHVCSTNCFLYELSDYPAHALNWSTQDPTTPDMLEASKRTNLPVIGGVGQGTAVTSDSADTALDQAISAYDALKGRSFILGAGCTVPHSVNNQTLKSIRELVETWSEN